MTSEPLLPTVGDLLARLLDAAGVEAVFGVLSVHNLPLLEAIHRLGKTRYVCARGEAGAVNMADGHARVTGRVGVAVTSTGAGAGNACGALIEAQTAGTPLLHITGQVNLDYLDRGWGDVHEAKDQRAMLGAAGKAAFRVWSADTALGTLREALRVAMTPPCGPVSVEIPIDLQGARVSRPPGSIRPLAVTVPRPDAADIDRLADALASARRPLLWLGGGARHAGSGARRLLDLGFGAVTTIQGRGVVPEDDPRTLGAFNLQPPIARLYAGCDALLVAGSKLRVPETARHTLALPERRFRIDVDPQAEGRGYASEAFVCADAALALDALADRLEGRLRTDPGFHADLRAARAAAEAQMRENLGRYAAVCDELQAAAGTGFNWVRDMTISSSTWGHRLFRLFEPRQSAHASGGGIGQGLSMAIGAAVGTPGRRTLVLVGDGGLMLNAAELPTAVQENTGVVLLVMNDKGYGILRNLADEQFGGRRFYADLHTPDFGLLAKAHGYAYTRIASLDRLGAQLREALASPAPATLVEFDMDAIGPFARPFSGPRI
ncbi:thiamine pyrophosphate-binding protein [Ramlibacter sp. AW1]|uniref:Thiamine pyrophosphate-binding protein n=1 Tax=Ramlibacter aurantiacus TaxID=2801330 RepID=A0A936ZNC2_9BURK|nr:thiamine pyrophosphate-binding protein [Ramlibacter aurantiacus]MBL0422912.1 thiamine pyrophosphate-binding protein [Ramlibacter aurantiacus]